jgi:hypothetical protein
VSLQNEINGVAAGSLTAGIGSDVMGRGLYLVAGVSDGNGQAANTHYGQVDHVITHVGNLVERERSPLHDLAHGLYLVVLSHIDVLHAQGASALRNRFGGALGDEAAVDSPDAGQRNAHPVLSMEPFRLEGLLRGAQGQRPYLAIGEDAIDVEENQANPSGAFSSREIHSTIHTTFVFSLHLAFPSAWRNDGNVMRTTKLSHLHRVVAGAAIVLALVAVPAFASSKYAGIYSSEAPDSSEPTGPAGPAFSISLGPDGSATVTQDLGKGGALTTFGHWSDAGSQVTIKFDEVEGKPTDPPMVLQPSHDGLQAVSWNHTLWGKTTPPPLKKEESNWHANKKHGFL